MHRSFHWPFRRQDPTTTEHRSEDSGVNYPTPTSTLTCDRQRGGTWSTEASRTLGKETETDTDLDVEPEPGNEPPYGLVEVVQQPADRAGCVDLIAIHGLNGHCYKTWTDRTTGLNWLSDEECLPKDIPNARVLTFGYNSRTYFSRSDPDVRDFASELLAALKATRRDRVEQQRPIVFLCHSLGGLVFKQARFPKYSHPNLFFLTVSRLCGMAMLTDATRPLSVLMSKTSTTPTSWTIFAESSSSPRPIVAPTWRFGTALGPLCCGLGRLDILPMQSSPGT